MNAIKCSTDNFNILTDALVKAAEDNKIPHEEFIAFVCEFPRLLLGDKYHDVVYVPGMKSSAGEK